jgi:predicted DCC family thiol-disulfide oxidoreductase YuxK
MTSSPATPKQTKPILLFDNECGVCRHIAHWVHRSAMLESGESSIIERPIGDDPEALRALNPDLDIWDAYATIHILMPDGSMKQGGEAIAEVFRNLRNTRWFAWSFAISIFGFRPFQLLVNVAYAVLADIRPLFGCDSCGTPSLWVQAIRWLIKWPKVESGNGRRAATSPHFTHLSPTARRQ